MPNFQESCGWTEPRCLPENYILSNLTQGSVVMRAPVKVVKELDDGTLKERSSTKLVVQHVDIIRQQFWKEHPEVMR
jgi:hypothetical protein